MTQKAGQEDPTEKLNKTVAAEAKKKFNSTGEQKKIADVTAEIMHGAEAIAYQAAHEKQLSTVAKVEEKIGQFLRSKGINEIPTIDKGQVSAKRAGGIWNPAIINDINKLIAPENLKGAWIADDKAKKNLKRAEHLTMEKKLPFPPGEENDPLKDPRRSINIDLVRKERQQVEKNIDSEIDRQISKDMAGHGLPNYQPSTHKKHGL